MKLNLRIIGTCFFVISAIAQTAAQNPTGYLRRILKESRQLTATRVETYVEMLSQSVPGSPKQFIVETDEVAGLSETIYYWDGFKTNLISYQGSNISLLARSAISVSIAELRSGKAELAPIVNVTDPGKAGIFVYRAGSNKVDDSCMVVRFGNMRYERQFDGPWNVKWFNAKGDGTTNDTYAIQKAINAVAIARSASLGKEGGTLYFPEGDYRISSDLNDSLGVNILGAGDRSTTLRALPGSTFTNAMLVAGLSTTAVQHGISIKNIHIDGYSVARCGLMTSGWNEGCTWDNLWVNSNTIEQVRMNRNAALDINQNISLGRLRITSSTPGSDALVIDEVRQVTFNGISIDQPSSLAGIYRGILMTGTCEKNIFINVNIEDCLSPIEASGQSSNITFIGLNIHNPSTTPSTRVIDGLSGKYAMIFMGSTRGYVIMNYRNMSADKYDYDLIDVAAADKRIKWLLNGSTTLSGWQNLTIGRDASNNVTLYSDREFIAPTGSLTFGSVAGALSLGANNAISLISLMRGSISGDGNTMQTTGYYPYISTGTSTNFPSAGGAGFRIVRTDNSTDGYLDFWKSTGSSDRYPYFRTGNASSSVNSWYHIGTANEIKSISANYTALLTDRTILVDVTSGSVTVALPTAAAAYANGVGTVYILKKIDGTSNTLTIDGDGSEVIDGSATIVLTAQWQTVRIQSNGTSWFVI